MSACNSSYWREKELRQEDCKFKVNLGNLVTSKYKDGVKGE
jgi:hypothetical protein